MYTLFIKKYGCDIQAVSGCIHKPFFFILQKKNELSKYKKKDETLIVLKHDTYNACFKKNS